MNRWNAIVLTLVIVSAVVWVNLPTKPVQADMKTTSNFSGRYQLTVRYDNGSFRYTTFDSDTGQFVDTNRIAPVFDNFYTIIPNAKGGCYVLYNEGTVWKIPEKGDVVKVFDAYDEKWSQ